MRQNQLQKSWDKAFKRLLLVFKVSCTEEPRNSAFQGICGFYTLLGDMPYCQYIELKEKVSRDFEFMLS